MHTPAAPTVPVRLKASQRRGCLGVWASIPVAQGDPLCVWERGDQSSLVGRHLEKRSYRTRVAAEAWPEAAEGDRMGDDGLGRGRGGGDEDKCPDWV